MKRTQLIKSLLLAGLALLITTGLFFSGFRGVSHRDSNSQNAQNPAGTDGSSTNRNSTTSNGRVANTSKTAQGEKSTGSTTGATPAAIGAVSKDGSKTETGAAAVTSGSVGQTTPPCFTLTFKRPASTELLGEADSVKNLLQLGHSDINPASVCIRVNGSPVKHTLVSGTQDQFLIEPISTAKSEIVASFCTGSAKCSEPCNAVAPKSVAKPKDEFLEAISGESEDGINEKQAQWDEKDGLKNAEVNKALQGGIRDAISENTNTDSTKLAGKTHKAVGSKEAMTTWTVEKETPACFKQETARKIAANNSG